MYYLRLYWNQSFAHNDCIYMQTKKIFDHKQVSWSGYLVTAEYSLWGTVAPLRHSVLIWLGPLPDKAISRPPHPFKYRSRIHIHITVPTLLTHWPVMWDPCGIHVISTKMMWIGHHEAWIYISIRYGLLWLLTHLSCVTVMWLNYLLM